MDMAAMQCIKQMRNVVSMRQTVGMVWCRMFSAGGSKKKGGKGAASADAPKVSILSKEVKSSTAVGCNTLKEGSDPKFMADTEYPDWLWISLDKRTALSELKRMKAEDLPFEDLKRFAKLDNRARIKENNSAKAKN
ncbi:54S ribosomal protein L37, mitochondrial-like [Impatiens glandulifera]|uniref:54S ribosomal protein L37, mitochondrial-like n=1 Tax=Impatiens glandulifera TaxID=253017 RepID=UPI001FB0CED8|nr:54S ribosomal protein L37, mitochondrial-like [Impatiens glandulifera]